MALFNQRPTTQRLADEENEDMIWLLEKRTVVMQLIGDMYEKVGMEFNI